MKKARIDLNVSILAADQPENRLGYQTFDIATPKSVLSCATPFSIAGGGGGWLEEPDGEPEGVHSTEVEEGEPPRRTKEEDASKGSRFALLVVCHVLCVSSFMVVNKWALNKFPFIWTLVSAQCVFAAFVTYVAGKSGLIVAGPMELGTLLKSMPAAVIFVVTITSGNGVLRASNVDTLIVMRSVVSVSSSLISEGLVATDDRFSNLQPLRGIALLIFLLGTLGYCITNLEPLGGSTGWVLSYLMLASLHGPLVRQLLAGTALSPWGLVQHMNVCSAGISLLISIPLESTLRGHGAAAEYRKFGVLAPCALTCIIGVAISFMQEAIKRDLTSDNFALLGASNKFLSVLMNQAIGLDVNRHILSLGSVIASASGSTLFQMLMPHTLFPAR